MSLDDLYRRIGEAMARLRAAELRWAALRHRYVNGEHGINQGDLERARDRMHELRPPLEQIYQELDAAINRGEVCDA